MFTKFVCLVILVSPITAAVAKHVVNSCSPTEFACGDGGCVSAELVCDGNRDCADGLDEVTCDRDAVTLQSQEPVLNRSRRQASGCRKDQWRCRDGSCISFDGKCDGIVDCADGSDETHALCRNTVCQQNWFRCTYGACVDGTAPCNGDQECADNSDELLPRCRNETDEVRGAFKCLDGSTIPAANHCDGVRDCADGSDETVRSCAAKSCPSYLFQCAYGACVDSDANCNQVQECADGSDEAPELCDKSGTAPITPTKPPTGNCVLPANPDHGTYVTNVVNGRPGEAYNFLAINVTCRQGYGVEGSPSISCFDGWWAEPLPKCVSLCHLSPHPSVEYQCLVTDGGVTGSRPCKEYEPHGTVVSPRCQTPNYYSPTSLKFMRCMDGLWDYVAICNPGLIKNGTNITIIVKDAVEIYVSDIKFVVPINNGHNMPVVPITDNDYSTYRPTINIPISNKPTTYKPTTYKPTTITTIRPTINRPTSNRPSDYTNNIIFPGMFETVSNKPCDNSIDTNNNNQNKGTESDGINSNIDAIDWRMGVPDNRGTRIPSTLNKAKKKDSYIDQNHFANFVHQTIRPAENNDREFSIDARFGEPNSHEEYHRTRSRGTTSSSPKKTTEAKLYTSKNNTTKIYLNTAHSSVKVHADGATLEN